MFDYLSVMGCVSWIILGGIAGWLASIITGNSGRNGCLTNIILGVIGAGVGGMIVNFFGGTPVTGFNLWSFFVAVIGAVVVLGVFNLLRGR